MTKKYIALVDDEKNILHTRNRVTELCLKFPIYDELIINEMS